MQVLTTAPPPLIRCVASCSTGGAHDRRPSSTSRRRRGSCSPISSPPRPPSDPSVLECRQPWAEGSRPPPGIKRKRRSRTCTLSSSCTSGTTTASLLSHGCDLGCELVCDLPVETPASTPAEPPDTTRTESRAAGGWRCSWEVWARPTRPTFPCLHPSRWVDHRVTRAPVTTRPLRRAALRRARYDRTIARVECGRRWPRRAAAT